MLTSTIPHAQASPLDFSIDDDVDYDLVFVGAGTSTAYTLLSLLAQLRKRPPSSPVRLCVIDRDPDAYSGVPYGGRSARTSLLLTSLRDFLPDGERALFSDWLSRNKSWVFQGFLADAGPLATRWWARHREAIQRDEFEALFLPRYVFGVYLMERAHAAIEAAREQGVATVENVTDDVVAIDPVGHSYTVSCRNGMVGAASVVVAVGSPPTMPRLHGERTLAGAVLLDRPFDDMQAALRQVRRAVQEAGEAPHVVLIGGNASTMDLLYQINDLAIPEIAKTRFTILSLRGELPELMTDPDPDASFTPELLRELEAAEQLRAVSLFEAAVGDIARGRAAGMAVADTLPPISAAVRGLLPQLSAEEAAAFAGRWGTELGRYQRRAGWEYCEVASALRTEGRLRLVAGSFVDVEVGDDWVPRATYQLEGILHRVDPRADVVINCGGFVRDLRETAPSLLAHLVTSGVCRMTPFGGGIQVDSSCAAAPGLYVMGPLLAGNVVNGAPIWHMEHCGRISSYGEALGTALAETLLTDRT